MFPSSGVFNDLICPLETGCHRVYCPFWHNPPDSTVPRPSSPKYDPSSYNASFYGYTAFVDGASSSSLYAPEVPLQTVQTPSSSYDINTEESYGLSAKKKNGSKTLEGMIQGVPQTKDKNKLLNDYIAKVSELNKKIEELTKGEDSSKKKKTAVGYVPTPISEIERRKKEKEKMKEKKTESVDTLIDSLFEEPEEPKIEPPSKKKKKKVEVEREEEEVEVVQVVKTSRTCPPSKTPSLTPNQIAAAKTRLARPAARSVQFGVDVSTIFVMLLMLWWIYTGAFRKDRCDNGYRAEPRGFVAARRSHNRRLARQTTSPKKIMSAAVQLQRRMATAAEKEKERLAVEREKSKDSPKHDKMTEGEKMAQLSNGRTAAASIGKGDTRRAHSDSQRPSTSRSEKPQLRDAMDGKIGMAVRSTILDKFFTHFLKVCPNRQAAIESAEEEEKKVKDAAYSKQGYQVSALNTLRRLRESVHSRAALPTKAMKISHSSVLAGRHGSDITVGLRRSRESTVLSEREREELLHASLLKYLLNEEQLVNNGYPRWEDEGKTRVVMQIHEMDRQRGKKSFVHDHDLQRSCSRCQREFTVNKHGKPIFDRCTYHHNRLIKKRSGTGGWESVYGCCDGDLTSGGCAIADTHVFDTLRHSDLESFIETPEPTGDDDIRSKRVLAMDCEMVYTTWGPALARVSVVDMKDDLVLDIIVKPDHPLIDANSRFSGLDKDTVEAADKSLDDARKALFELVNKETILIGHSLESDLKAMRILHSRVVDTSVVFPHRNGPPLKRALRTLASEILMRIIQEDVNGHDSKEDSSTCMALMLDKLKKDGIKI